jgi:DNA-binding response OmpR family regulator
VKLPSGRETARLVLTEPDPDTATPLIHAATEHGISTHWCRDGAATLLAVGAENPTALVIAAHTDTVNAAQVTASVRTYSDIPILIGAGPGDDKLARQALAAGASALVARPYDLTAITRLAAIPETNVFAAGPIQVDLGTYEARVHGREIPLTQRELELLVYLIQRSGRVASQEEISQAVWGHATDTNTVVVHIKRLREKLGADPEHGRYIRTIRGVGYCMVSSVYR